LTPCFYGEIAHENGGSMARFMVSFLSVALLGFYSLESSSMMVGRVAKQGTGRAHTVRQQTRLYKKLTTRFNVKNLEKRDPVRNLQAAIIAGDKEKIGQYAPAAGYITPSGSTPIINAIQYAKPARQKELMQFLMMYGANPQMPHLVTFQTPKDLSEQIEIIRKESMNMDGLSTHNQYFLMQLIPIAMATKFLLTNESAATTKKLVKIYKDARRDNEHDVVHEMMVKLLHNGVAVSTSLLLPFSGQLTAISPELLAVNKKRFGVKNRLGIHAKLLALVGVIEDTSEEAQLVLSAQLEAERLAPAFIVGVAKVIRALMLHPEVKLFADDPQRAHLLLARNFAAKPMFKLPNPEAHKKAHRIIQNAIKRLKPSL
jgi:hypothetical protein